MATILLSAAGAAVGAGFGGTVLGLSGAVIGRAVGATLGRVIDQRLLGGGSSAVETGRIDRFRLTGANEGAPVGILWGRMRVAGQVIWATRFRETSSTTSAGGGKGAPKQKVTEYSYSVSLAIALCEGEITGVGRIWADGIEIARDDIAARVYSGSEDQVPDPKIEAVEGVGMAPSYRGLAYVLIEDLDLGQFGNRVPQFTFEVLRSAKDVTPDAVKGLTESVRGVALIPGTGEYALATTPVHFEKDLGENLSINVNSPSGKTDLATSLENLRVELPNCGSVSLVVSWFGDDLRCGECQLKPKVEQTALDGSGMPWSVAGVGRADAETVPMDAERPVYGGTPTDAAVRESIRAIRAGGQEVVFYPFILMEQMVGNGRSDPWTDDTDQPPLPWRGRITLSKAPGRSGSPDRSAAALAEVASFLGRAEINDFELVDGEVRYIGPEEWSYRRFILHYAHLCAAAGGVEAFCVGSEMRGLTQVRGAGDDFPVVEAMRRLAADVRGILGPSCRIGYAADWSEYFGYQSPEGNRYFHLDSLWADGNIDFVGIDNYMPLSDWRDGTNHADAAAGSIYSLPYLKSNVEGGEGYDWYYAASEHREAQIRTPISDDVYEEPWVWRYKDIRGWWSNLHHERIGGVRSITPTAWVPGSKPIWFTEFGCPAVDKGANEPNKFVDPKSSESSLPRYSDGRRDDLMQMQYLRAVTDYWRDPSRNPRSDLYAGRMIDMSRAHVWAWDARPFPHFPANEDLWSDGVNYRLGHWISGRTSAQPLAAVVAEICARSGLLDIDVSGLFGLVRGYGMRDVDTARAALQPLMLGYGFDAIERDGQVVFRMRDGLIDRDLGSEDLALSEGLEGSVETSRALEAEIAGRLRLAYVEAEGDYATRIAEAAYPDKEMISTSNSEMALALTRSEAQAIVERWMTEARVARDAARFALPPSLARLGAGDVVQLDLDGEPKRYRIDRVEQAGANLIDAVRIEPAIFLPSDEAEERVIPRPFAAPVPTFPLFLDLPMLRGDEVPHAPHIAVAAKPWPGSIAIYSSASDNGYSLNTLLTRQATVGRTQSSMGSSKTGVWDRGAPLRVKMGSGSLSSAPLADVLNGANVMAIGDGTGGNWEVFQFSTAELVGPGLYDISVRLRGQAGTGGVQPEGWPPGSLVVLIDGAPQQIKATLAERNLARHYMIGSARRGYDDPSYVHKLEAFAGVGLRPYSPCHLRSARTASGDLTIDWVRRTRLDGDSWSSIEVPLAEASERFLVRVVADGAVRREHLVTTPTWTYARSLQLADGLTPQYEVHVAQISDSFGPGVFERIEIDE